MYCDQCGTENPDNKRFCIDCGANLSIMKPNQYRQRDQAPALRTRIDSLGQDPSPQGNFISYTSPTSFVDDIAGYPFTVQVSARKLEFPTTCPCCTRIADTVLPLVFTRTTGKRVVHNTSRGWEAPYCNVCLHHNQAQESARAELTGARVLLSFQFVGIAILFLYLMIVGFGTLSQAHGFTVALVVGIGIFLFGGCFALAGLAVRRYQNVNLPRAQELWRQALALKRDSCCDISTAIRYDGWYGSVQTFAFKRDDYARSFASLNASKLVNWRG